MSEHETEQTPPDPEPERPRRFLRSRDDRMIGGVAGGLGKYFNVDPVFFRVGLVALVVVGGIGLILYLAALLFVPVEGEAGDEPPRRSRLVTIAGAILLVCLGAVLLSDGGFFWPLAFLLLAGAVVWWLVWGRGGAPPGSGRSVLARIAIVALILVGSLVLLAASVWVAAAGGGIAVAVLVIAIGALLALAAFRGGARWLIVPALAIAGGLGIVSAADIDLDGGHGKRTYAPSSLEQLRASYDLGAGSLKVDLRRVDFDGAQRDLDVEVGFGEAVVIVPRDVCVVADADVGAGYLRMFGWDDGGFNVGWDDGDVAAPGASVTAAPTPTAREALPTASTPTAPPASRLVVDAHVGMGALQFVHDPRDAEGHDDDWDGPGGRWDDVHEEEDPALGRSAGCEA